MINQDQGITQFGAIGPLKYSLFLVSFLPLLLFLAGCRNCEHVETALRMREQDLLHMRQELLGLEFRNQALQRRLHTLHQPIPNHQSQIAPPSAGHVVSLQKITLGRTTGGFNDDKHPGDEALQVVIEPRDMSDEIIKAPGSAEVTALEISADGLKKPIGAWQIAAAQIDRSWKRALFANGYVIVLPWQKKPQSHQLRVVVRFRMADGKEFEAEKDVRLRLQARMPRAGEIAPSPGIPLHPPRKLTPANQGIITPLSSFSLFRWLNGNTGSTNAKRPQKAKPLKQSERSMPNRQMNSSSQWRVSEEEQPVRLLRPVLD